MENQTDFVLDRAIADWRERLGQSPSYRAENLAELESHLRDSVGTLVGRGLTEEEAFLIAARRVGAPAVIEPEFAKVNRKEIWLGRSLWMLLGIQVWGLITTFAGAMSWTGSQLLIAAFRHVVQAPVETDHRMLGIPVTPAIMVLFFVADIAALAAMSAGCWWLVKKNAGGMSRLLHRESYLVWGAIAFCLALLVGTALRSVGQAVLVRTIGQAGYGSIVWSMSMAGLVLFFLKTIALASLTVFLARRHLRQVSP
jgi:hypothetical protein